MHFRRFRGFSLAEIIGAMLVTTILWVGFSNFFNSLMESTRLPSMTSSVIPLPAGIPVLPDGTGYSATTWNTYERAPSLSALRNASVLFADFMDMLDRADLVVVMGGAGGYPLNRGAGPGFSSNPAVAYGPTLPGYFGNATSFSWAGSNPRRLSSSYEVQQVLPSAAFQSVYDNSSFTVLFFRGTGDLIAVTECYRNVVNGKVLYAVNHYREPKVSGALTGGGLGLHSYYRFYLDSVTDDNWSLPPGATHYWYRYDTAWMRVEEGPCRTVFPDPYLLLAQSGPAATLPLSRFIFFLDPLN